MSDVSLQQASALNQELCSLSSIGLPLDVGVEGQGQEVVDKLQKFESLLATRVQRGSTVDQAIADEPQLPSKYRAALLAWLRCEDPTLVLDAISKPAEARQQFRRNIGHTLVYPLIVLSLAYFGFIYLCQVTVPGIEALYRQLWREPSDSLSMLMTSRALMPIWVPLVPLLLVLVLLWWRSRSSQLSWSWVPGNKRYFTALQNADLAEQLAMLVDSRYSIDRSLELVGLLRGTAPVATRDQPAGTGRAQSPAINPKASMPSLLRWALSGDLGGEPLPRVLHFVAQTYRQTAQRQQTIWRVAVPAICGVLLGGAFVLGYALTLFVPVVQLLKDVALPGGA
jgi:type II secretory pathway component PulF